MCGICGIITPDFSENERKNIVQKMSDVMVHRGPDDSGIVSLKYITLGHQRLSIIDLSKRARQPMVSKDGRYYIVYNGEIYNYRELRKYLLNRGHTFKSLSDTEVIIHLYEEHGPECVHKLRGMFSFAIYDEAKRELFIARDRLGIKPLYYSVPSSRFLFASEIKSIVKSGLIEPELDLEAVDLYLSFGYVPPPWTILKGVYALLPGHYIHVNDAHVTVERWWCLPEPGTTQCPYDEIIPQVRYLLEESIRLHQVSDVPIGAFLSGGIDSTAVVGLMSRVSDKPIKTFSVGFENDVPGRFNELTHANLVARKFQAEHTEVILKGQEVVDELENVVWYLDQPSFDGINSYFVSRAARQGGLKVALSGLGADELFGGYGSYQVIPRLSAFVKCWGRMPESVRTSIVRFLESTVGKLSNNDRTRKIGRLCWVNSPVALYALARFTLWPLEKKELYSSCFLKELESENGHNGSLSLLQEYVDNNYGPWRMVTGLELQTFMNWRLLRDTDVMSMAHSLEVRVPFIDHRLVEFICGLPEGWEKRLGYPKRLLTNALSELIPEDIINRPKHGFEFPIECWMRRELRQVVEDTLSDSSIKSRGLFSPDGVRSLYRGFLRGNYSYPEIWQLVILELWLRRMVDNKL